MSEKCLIQSQKTITKTVDIYIRGEIEEFEDYDELVKELSSLKKDDSLVVHLNTPGGDCSVGFFLVDQFLNLECPVHMVVDYPTYSMGSILALCGDELTINPDSYIMFHDYSGGSKGKGEETYQYSVNYRKMFKDRFTRLCKPFLSQNEINNMFKGEDIYIHHDDPSLKERIKRHFK